MTSGNTRGLFESILWMFFLGKKKQNERVVWTYEPNSYPFWLSSLISSLSSLKVRRLRWRNKTFMAWHPWNAKVNALQKQVHTLSCTVFSQFVESHETNIYFFSIFTSREMRNCVIEWRATGSQSRIKVKDVIAYQLPPKHQHDDGLWSYVLSS